jgi:hypothetical protein
VILQSTRKRAFTGFFSRSNLGGLDLESGGSESQIRTLFSDVQRKFFPA